MSCYQKIYLESLSKDIPKTYWASLPERHTGRHYPKTYWTSLPEDILGVITRGHTGSHYPKTYWHHYPKTYWASLPEDILGHAPNPIFRCGPIWGCYNPEEEEEDEVMENDEEDDAEIADVDDIPIPPVIQFGNFHVGESSASRDLLEGNSEVCAPGPISESLKMMRLITDLNREFTELKDQNRRAEELSRWKSWVRGRIPNSLRFPEEPSIHIAPVPRADDPYVMVKMLLGVPERMKTLTLFHLGTHNLLSRVDPHALQDSVDQELPLGREKSFSYPILAKPLKISVLVKQDVPSASSNLRIRLIKDSLMFTLFL
nr:hypothetical protein [Tanacetum cinerariifolium]